MMMRLNGGGEEFEGEETTVFNIKQDTRFGCW